MPQLPAGLYQQQRRYGKIKDSQWHSVMTNNTDAGSSVPYQYVEYFFFDKSSDLSGKCYIDGFDLMNADIKKAGPTTTSR